MERKALFTASTYSHIVNFHLPYLQWFQQQGWEVHAACGGTPQEIPFADRVINLPLEKSMGSPKNFQAAALLRRIIRQEGYDFVSTHTALAAFFTRLALAGLGERPAVANMVHGYLFDQDTPALKRQLLLAAERMTAPQTDLLLTMNQWDYEAAQKYRLGRSVVHIPGVGVDFSRFDRLPETLRQDMRGEYGFSPETFVLIYGAEFSKRKSQETLIRAMALLPEDIALILAGDGALRAECQALASELGLEARILFPGHIRDMGRWYAMADAAVSASRSEGLPFNIMEAMYAGLPLAVSAVKGHVDLIRDGETGLLFPYGDAADCAAAIRRLREDPQLRQALAGRAREKVLEYRLDRVFPLVVEQYGALLPERTAAG